MWKISTFEMKSPKVQTTRDKTSPECVLKNEYIRGRKAEGSNLLGRRSKQTGSGEEVVLAGCEGLDWS